MKKIFYSLGLMSGTSMDGIDASIISSNGEDVLEVIENKYFKYEDNFIDRLSNLKNKIKTALDLKLYLNDLNSLEREITILHAEFIDNILKNFKKDIDLIGFHGQTIYHNSDEKISRQLGDGKLLSQLIKKKIVFNFRENDIENNGNGAPLAPIYHCAITKKINKKNIIFLNIGGIANETFVDEKFKISAKDLGPGNCLIDLWIRKNTKNKYDKDGNISKLGKVNKILLDQSLDIYFNNKISNKRSYDINDFDISFFRGLTLEDGAATIIEFTVEIIANKLSSKNIICCGGGRKNKYLIERLEKKINKKILYIDEFKIDGDFIESQAFAFLAIRSFLNLPISFPMTTGCHKDSTGGVII
tara:strand:- start:287 stop:1363 length:1077 start_codon:yes stop_codon:yes gene_type:complete